MELSEFADTCEAISDTNSGNEKRDIIAEKFGEISRDNAIIFARFLTDEKFDDPDVNTNVKKNRLFNAATKISHHSKDQLGEYKKDLGKPELAIEKAIDENKQMSFNKEDMTIESIYKKIKLLPDADGDKERERIVSDMLSACNTGREAKWVSYCIIGKISTGAGEKTVAKGWAKHEGLDVDDVYLGMALLGTLPNLMQWYYNYGYIPDKPQVNQAFHPMLAEGHEEFDFDDDWVAQPKFDGSRVLIHSDGKNIRVFSRNTKEVTESLPEITENLSPRSSEFGEYEYIIDGEAVAYDAETDEPLPFENIMKRFRREHDINEIREEIEVKVWLFDCIVDEGKDITQKPFSIRAQHLDKVLAHCVDDYWTDKFGDEYMYHRSEYLMAAPFDRDIEGMYNLAISEGHEGVIVKKLDAKYEFDERASDWKKLKPSETIDVQVVDFEWGTGENAGKLGALRVETGDGVEIGKVGTGFTDKNREEFTPENTVGEIVEIEVEEIQETEKGYGMRFPRFIRVRDHKDDADDLERVLSVVN